MSYFLEISEAAKKDILEAYLWYEEQREGLGAILEEHLSEATEAILYNPKQSQIRYENTRIFFLKRFPYGIHYNIFGNKILVVAVFHTSRNPQKWRGYQNR